jgi:hypothetical protein
VDGVIPAPVFEQVAEAWLARFDDREEGFQLLAASSGLTAGAWRKRLCATPYTSSRTRIVYPHGWYGFDELDVEKVDEFLVAADAPHLWHEPPLAAYAPAHEKIDGRYRVGNEPRVKRLSKASLLTREQIHAIHRLHIEGGHSVRSIVRAGWRTWGYANERSATNAVFGLLASFGLKCRPRAEATVMANRQRMMRLPGESKNAFKARRRRETGEVRGVRCKGVRRQYPRKGEPCQRPALADSEYCRGHDPRFEAENRERLERARARARLEAAA